ncbi:LOW QUALITY PROTEIN: hypothetical protein GQ55_4G010000 [Panicum hallii var. hallii]|uniref:Peptidase A1 domain-containing protein n=1 Tax=Panicum hallii var. hallii TaxID=1504633 RepID=A0A2T7DTZ2_9POAL|nr:LOW QUALITY PROTEIN: hypothetical protein GQ55_4G010000 [Panicum hallii var. hallii]
MGMLLVAVAASLLLSAMLQVPPLASAAFFRPPKFGDSIYCSTPTLLNKKLKDILRKHGSDADDIAQNFLTPPQMVTRTRQTAVSRQTAGLYLANLQVGTPDVQTISGVLDISSQLVWMRCDTNCTACPQSASYFLTQKSETFNFLSCADNNYCRYCSDEMNDRCGYTAEYSDSSMYTAFDSFTFDTTAVTMLFVCTEIDSAAGDYSGASGVIGLGRGQLSLVSQLGLSNFSYFLAPDVGDSDSDSQSQVQLGGVAVPQTGRVHTTPLYRSSLYTDPYYIRLTGIRVDGFDFRSDGSGGAFLSTTMPFTYLLSDAYAVVREAFASRIFAQPLGQGSLDPLCYSKQSMTGVEFPKLTLVFEGEDAALELRTDNYFLSVGNDDDQNGSELVCLTVLPSTGASLLGSLLQTGTTMIYDLNGEQLTFVMMEEKEKEKEGSYSPPQPSSISEAPAASLAMAVAVAVGLL